MSGRVGELFASLRPAGAVWSPPVLEVASAGPPFDHRLGGRGIALVPSVFAGPKAELPYTLRPDLDTPDRMLPVTEAHAAITRSVRARMASGPDPARALRRRAGQPAK